MFVIGEQMPCTLLTDFELMILLATSDRDEAYGVASRGKSSARVDGAWCSAPSTRPSIASNRIPRTSEVASDGARRRAKRFFRVTPRGYA